MTSPPTGNVKDTFSAWATTDALDEARATSGSSDSRVRNRETSFGADGSAVQRFCSTLMA